MKIQARCIDPNGLEGERERLSNTHAHALLKTIKYPCPIDITKCEILNIDTQIVFLSFSFLKKKTPDTKLMFLISNGNLCFSGEWPCVGLRTNTKKGMR